MKTFKGRGEHSVSQLEEIIELQEEQLYQKQLINQDLLKALQELLDETAFKYKAFSKSIPQLKAEKAISKALD